MEVVFIEGVIIGVSMVVVVILVFKVLLVFFLDFCLLLKLLRVVLSCCLCFVMFLIYWEKLLFCKGWEVDICVCLECIFFLRGLLILWGLIMFFDVEEFGLIRNCVVRIFWGKRFVLYNVVVIDVFVFI